MTSVEQTKRGPRDHQWVRTIESIFNLLLAPSDMGTSLHFREATRSMSREICLNDFPRGKAITMRR